MTAPVFVMQDLRVGVRGEVPAGIVSGLSLEIKAGECVALCGPSGSGKSTACLAPFGMAAPNLEAAGTHTLSGMPAAVAGRKYRSGAVAFVLQEPAANFAPHLPVGVQLHDLSKDTNFENWLIKRATQLGLLELERLLLQLPAQCSGGELQRLALIAALAQRPQLLVADEPTAALDAASRVAWCRLVGEHCEQGLAVLLVSHDASVLAEMADRRVTLDHQPAAIAASAVFPPASDCVPEMSARRPAHAQARPAALLRMEVAGGVRRNAPDAPAPWQLALPAGTCVALVGPSGSGKTSLLQAALGLPTPLATRVEWAGSPLLPWPDATRRAIAGQMAAVPQDARLALNPYRPVLDSVAAAFRRRGVDWRTSRRRAEEALAAVGLTAEHWRRRPAALSVGQAQRAALVQALAVEPALLVCDEPTSAQDSWHRELVVRCLLRAQNAQGVAVLLATHDLEMAETLGATCVRLGE